MSTATMASALHPPKRRSRSAPGPPVDATANDGVLPVELLHDILLRLPAKSICRFRAVCTSWHSLLCHPDFIAAAEPGPSITVGVCMESGPSNIVGGVLNMEFGHVLNRVIIDATSHHGLLPPHEATVLSPDRAVCVIGRDGQLRLIDPATGAVELLPFPFPPPADHKFISCALGCTALTAEYKVLAITNSNSNNHMRQICKILTLNDNNGGEQRWRQTMSPPFSVVLQPRPSTFNRQIAVVNNVVYLLIELDMWHGCIMAFHLGCEVWKPDALRCPAGQNIVSLATLQGQLVVCREDHKTYELWFLEDLNRDRWSMRHKIRMPYHKVRSPLATSLEYFVKPLAVTDDRKIILWMWVAPPGFNDTLDAVMRCYDPITKVFTDEMLVTKCNDVTVRTWSILYAGRGGREQH